MILFSKEYTLYNFTLKEKNFFKENKQKTKNHFDAKANNTHRYSKKEKLPI